MNRIDPFLRVMAVVGLLTGIAFWLAPVNSNVDPRAAATNEGGTAVASLSRANADSLTEDIILYNLFSPRRTPPSRRYAATGDTPDGTEEPNAVSMSAGFRPELIGTAVSDRPGETRALLRLVASDPGPRLYAVGERAGGYTVVSIDARSVVLTGPGGRIVLRLPENEESYS